MNKLLRGLSLGTTVAMLLTLVLVNALPATGAAAPSDVVVTNTNTNPVPVDLQDPSLPVTQSGAWNVGIVGTPMIAAQQSGAWNVGVGTPTVRPGLPTEAYFERVSLSQAVPQRLVGLNRRHLAVTTITITNFDATSQQVDIQNVRMSGPGCSGSRVAVFIPTQTILVNARQTLHLDFPTPLVFAALSPSGTTPTHTCIEYLKATGGTGSVVVVVSGFAVA